MKVRVTVGYIIEPFLSSPAVGVGRP